MKRIFSAPALAVGALLCLTACHEDFDKRLSREAREYTDAHCPWEPEAGTRMDSVAYDVITQTYSVYYTLAPENEAALRSNLPLLRQMLLRELRDNVDYRELKDHRVTFGYVYRSAQGGGTVYATSLRAEEYLQ